MPSYQQRGKNKLWSVRFPIMIEGKEIQKRLSGFDTKKAAREAYVEFMANLQANLKTQILSKTNIMDRNFSDVFAEYKIYKEPRLRCSTFYELNSNANLYIVPYFGKHKMKEISKIMVLNWQHSLEHFSYKYKSKIRSTLFSFYRWLNMYYDVDNIVARVEPFKVPIEENKEMKIWSYDEFSNFISNFEESDFVYRAFFSFLYYTGCRRGEALAINFRDFNLHDKTVSINKSVTRKGAKNSADGLSWEITPPKTSSSYRTILLPNNLCIELDNYLKKNPFAKTGRFLFGVTHPLYCETIYRRFETYTQKANIQKIRIHDLRHSHASLLIEHGASILLVSKRLGHKSTKETLDTYAHLFPTSEANLIQIINKAN